MATATVATIRAGHPAWPTRIAPRRSRHVTSSASGLSQCPAASTSSSATAATEQPSTVTTAVIHAAIARRGAPPSAVI